MKTYRYAPRKSTKLLLLVKKKEFQVCRSAFIKATLEELYLHLQAEISEASMSASHLPIHQCSDATRCHLKSAARILSRIEDLYRKGTRTGALRVENHAARFPDVHTSNLLSHDNNGEE